MRGLVLVAASLVTFGAPPKEPPPFLEIKRIGHHVVVTWRGGELQRATNLLGPWLTLSNAASPALLPVDRPPMLLFRLH